MLYIGWDIGIKNLAYCIIEYKNNKEVIKELNIINLIEDQKNKEYEDLLNNKCCMLNKNNTNCKGKIHYINNINNNFYCKKHYTLDNLLKSNKSVKEIKKPKKIKCKSISLETIGKTLIKKLDNNPLFLKCRYVIIENQPVLKNPTMKSIQIMLYTYFLIKNKKMEQISLVNASNKLKVYKDKLDEDTLKKINVIKDKYRKNKFTAIIHTDKFMLKNNESEFLNYFHNHKKKDDLADAYLMCKYFINKNNN